MLFSKIMATKMKMIMNKIIFPLQAAHVQGRQISYNIQLAQEIIHLMKLKKEVKGFLALKLDMSKAFDRIKWSFLMDVMQKIGFSQEWCSLII